MESANAIRGAAFTQAPEYFVNTVGRGAEAIRAYIRNQEKEDQRLEQMNLSTSHAAFGSSNPDLVERPLVPLRAGSNPKAPGFAEMLPGSRGQGSSGFRRLDAWFAGA